MISGNAKFPMCQAPNASSRQLHAPANTRTKPPYPVVAGKEAINHKIKFTARYGGDSLVSIEDYDEATYMHKVRPLPRGLRKKGDKKVSEGGQRGQQQEKIYPSSEYWVSLAKTCFEWQGPMPAVNCLFKPGVTPVKSAAVNHRVRVFWPHRGTWYKGKVVEYDSKSQMHTLNYVDGTRQHKIQLKKWAVLWLDIPELSGETVPPACLPLSPECVGGPLNDRQVPSGPLKDVTPNLGNRTRPDAEDERGSPGEDGSRDIMTPHSGAQNPEKMAKGPSNDSLTLVERRRKRPAKAPRYEDFEYTQSRRGNGSARRTAVGDTNSNPASAEAGSFSQTPSQVTERASWRADRGEPHKGPAEKRPRRSRSPSAGAPEDLEQRPAPRLRERKSEQCRRDRDAAQSRGTAAGGPLGTEARKQPGVQPEGLEPLVATAMSLGKRASAQQSIEPACQEGGKPLVRSAGAPPGEAVPMCTDSCKAPGPPGGKPSEAGPEGTASTAGGPPTGGPQGLPIPVDADAGPADSAAQAGVPSERASTAPPRGHQEPGLPPGEPAVAATVPSVGAEAAWNGALRREWASQSTEAWQAANLSALVKKEDVPLASPPLGAQRWGSLELVSGHEGITPKVEDERRAGPPASPFEQRLHAPFGDLVKSEPGEESGPAGMKQGDRGFEGPPVVGAVTAGTQPVGPKRVSQSAPRKKRRRRGTSPEVPGGHAHRKSFLEEVGPVAEASHCRVGIWWEADSMFYKGMIVEFSPPRSFLIEYDDGEHEWLDLTEHRFQWLTPRGASSGAASRDLLSLMVYLKADNLEASDTWAEFRKSVDEKSLVGEAAQARIELPPVAPGGWDGAQPAEEDLVGSLISLKSPVMGREHVGEVLDAIKEAHFVLYEDGEHELLDLRKERLRYIGPARGRQQAPGYPPGPPPPKGRQAVGWRIGIYGKGTARFEDADVVSYDNGTGKHSIVYDDGSTDVVSLSTCKLKWVLPPNVVGCLASGAVERPPRRRSSAAPRKKRERSFSMVELPPLNVRRMRSEKLDLSTPSCHRLQGRNGNGSLCLYPEDTENIEGTPALTPILGLRLDPAPNTAVPASEPTQAAAAAAGKAGRAAAVPLPKFPPIVERTLEFPAVAGRWRRVDYMVHYLQKLLPPNPAVQICWDEMFEAAASVDADYGDDARFDAMIEKCCRAIKHLEAKPFDTMLESPRILSSRSPWALQALDQSPDHRRTVCRASPFQSEALLGLSFEGEPLSAGGFRSPPAAPPLDVLMGCQSPPPAPAGDARKEDLWANLEPEHMGLDVQPGCLEQDLFGGGQLPTAFPNLRYSPPCQKVPNTPETPPPSDERRSSAEY
eukprot:jgi/Botrbrau1/4851/Bobra.0032s0012.1